MNRRLEEESNRFRQGLEALHGEVCWSAMGGVGSLLCLDFGKKIVRHKPIQNPTLTDNQARFYGEYSIYIGDTPWTLRERRQLICNNRVREDAISLVLKKLEGLAIQSSSVTEDLSVVSIIFEHGFKLSAFPSLGETFDDVVSFRSSSGWTSILLSEQGLAVEHD